MKKKAAGLDALKQTQPVQDQPAKETPPEKKKSDKTIFSLHIPRESHDKLRELSFHERQSMTKLLLEGLDLLFEKRGVK